MVKPPFYTSDQQSVASSPGRGTSIFKQDTLPQLLCPSNGTLSHGTCVLGMIGHVKEPSTLNHGRVGVNPSASGVQSKHPCKLQ